MKPAVAKAKGVETESIFVDFLHSMGIVTAERRRLSGAQDKGDIAGWRQLDGSKNVVVEVKSGAQLSLPQWLRELAQEKINAKGDLGFLAVRPKGKPKAEDWYAIMPMPEFMELVREAGYMYD